MPKGELQNTDDDHAALEAVLVMDSRPSSRIAPQNAWTRLYMIDGCALELAFVQTSAHNTLHGRVQSLKLAQQVELRFESSTLETLVSSNGEFDLSWNEDSPSSLGLSLEDQWLAISDLELVA